MSKEGAAFCMGDTGEWEDPANDGDPWQDPEYTEQVIEETERRCHFTLPISPAGFWEACVAHADQMLGGMCQLSPRGTGRRLAVGVAFLYPGAGPGVEFEAMAVGAGCRVAGACPDAKDYADYLRFAESLVKAWGGAWIERPRWGDRAQAEAPKTEAPTSGGQDGAARRFGRPRNVADDWAHEQERSGRPRKEVYAEWRKRPDVISRGLTVPWDSYRKAMRYREKREKRD
jgi:hypothetical protein